MGFDYRTLDPQLRIRGRLLHLLQRFSMPPFTSAANGFLKTFVSGKNLTKGASMEQVFLPGPGDTRLRICIFRPKEPISGKVPGVLWLHGGGYLTGVPEQDFGFYRRLMTAAPCVIIAPDYRRSVEAPYPAALEDALAAWHWLLEQQETLGLDPSCLTIGGDSAGGGLCAALCLYLRDHGEQLPSLQLPLYPMLDDRPTKTNQNNQAPGWDTRSNDVAWRLYLGERCRGEAAEVYGAPARETDLSGLPPTLTFVGDVEPFYQETVDYVNLLRGCRILTAFRVFPGCFHGFDILGRGTKKEAAVEFFISQIRSFWETSCFLPEEEDKHAV